jgi:hypothetical protein
MNEPLDDLVGELGRLRPSQPARRLTRRVEAALAEEAGAAPAPAEVLAIAPARPPGSPEPGIAGGGWGRWLPLAAAFAVIAAVVVSVALRPKAPQQVGPTPLGSTGGIPLTPPVLVRAQPGPEFRRVRAADYLVDAEDHGLIYTSTSTPWRKVTWQYVSSSEWRNERDRTTYQVLIPREETVVIPVRID